MVCPFCHLDSGDRVVYDAGSALLIVPMVTFSSGHCLAVTKAHKVSMLDASSDEIRDVWALVNKISVFLVENGYADGVNILSNMGEAAGQTVFHAHVHVVPRLIGDVSSARDWLSPEFKAREFYPNAPDVEIFSKKIRSYLSAL